MDRGMQHQLLFCSTFRILASRTHEAADIVRRCLARHLPFPEILRRIIGIAPSRIGTVEMLTNRTLRNAKIVCPRVLNRMETAPKRPHAGAGSLCGYSGVELAGGVISPIAVGHPVTRRVRFHGLYKIFTIDHL